MRKNKSVFIVVVFLFCCCFKSFAQPGKPGFTIVFEDRTDMRGDAFFSEITRYLNENAVSNVRSAQLKWDDWRPYQANNEDPTVIGKSATKVFNYFQISHLNSPFVFKFCLIGKDEVKTLKVCFWKSEGLAQLSEPGVMIFEDDIYLTQIREMMPNLMEHISHIVAGNQPKDKLYVNQIEEYGTACDNYRTGMHYFLYDQELTQKFYLLRYPCKKADEFKNTYVITCDRPSPTEFQFKYCQNSIAKSKLTFSCDRNEVVSKIRNYCKQILKWYESK